MLISSNSSTASTSTGNVTKTDTTYKDDNMEIEITTGKASDSTKNGQVYRDTDPNRDYEDPCSLLRR